MGKFAEHLAKVGRQLDSAVGSYNAAVGSFDHRVIPQLRSIEQAGISSERELAAPAAIETTARTVTAELDSDPRDEETLDRLDRTSLGDEASGRDPLEAAAIVSPGGISVDDRRALLRSAAE